MSKLFSITGDEVEEAALLRLTTKMMNKMSNINKIKANIRPPMLEDGVLKLIFLIGPVELLAVGVIVMYICLPDGRSLSVINTEVPGLLNLSSSESLFGDVPYLTVYDAPVVTFQDRVTVLLVM